MKGRLTLVAIGSAIALACGDVRIPTLARAPSGFSGYDYTKGCHNDPTSEWRAWGERQKAVWKRVGKTCNLPVEQRVRLAAMVEPNGQVRVEPLATDLPDCSVASCIQSEMSRASLEPPPRGEYGEFTVTLKGQDDNAGADRDPIPNPKDAPTTPCQAAPKPSTGRVPLDVIQKIVRASFGELRKCYDRALREDPWLEGRVSARFVIGRSGRVTFASLGPSDLPNCEMLECVRKSFSRLRFPPPKGGKVTVVYPVSFSPGR